MKGKGLRPRKREKLHVTFYLQKDEKKLLDEVAARYAGSSGVRSGISKAVAALIRFAIRCILQHWTETDDPKPISDQELLEKGVVPGDGFQVRKTKAQLEKERRDWKKRNPPKPIRRIK